MSVEVKVPEIGESITEVLIVGWFKKEGERVERDEPLAELETDKATVDLPAPVAGKVAKLLRGSGETAQVGELIALIEEGVKAEGGPAKEVSPPVGAAREPAEAEAVGPPKRKVEPAVMPAARRVLAEQGLEAQQIEATGPGGRLLKEDVLRHLKGKPKEEAGPSAAPKPPAIAGPGAREEEVVPMSPMRRRIAERLVQAHQSAALLSTFNEVDMEAVIALRKQYREAFERKYGVKLGLMSFFVKASIEGLRAVPGLNAEIRAQSIVYRNYFDIGVAVASGKGLVVPVLRNAERLSFAEIEIAIADYAARARENRINLEELRGGTFSITNGGVFGSLLSTPLINPPQSGILGVHVIQDRPVAREGQVVIRPMMYIALTYDHRVVDGREAITFLKRVKEVLEEPARLVLEV